MTVEHLWPNFDRRATVKQMVLEFLLEAVRCRKVETV
jgi:hypothetical protein